MEPHNQEDVKDIIYICVLSFIIEYFKITFDLSIFNIFLFINLIAIYYTLKKLRISVTISYNH